MDGGDALSRLWPSATAEKDRDWTQKRAAFLLQQMGAQGYQAMAVGERDLIFPVAELKKRAADAKILLLAANLVDAKGANAFAPRAVLTAGGQKVGLFAVCEGSEYEKAGLKVTPAAEAAQAQAQALRAEGATLVVALLHLSYDSALKVAAVLKGVDYAVQAHDGRTSTSQLAGETVLAAGGERGRALGRVVFGPEGTGPLFELSEAADARSMLADVEKQIDASRTQLAKHPTELTRMAPAMAAYEKRRADLSARAEAKPPPGRRTVQSGFLQLDASLPDHPETLKALAAIQALAPDRK